MASTRRHFLQATRTAPLALPAALAQQAASSPNDKIQFATIGCGIMGQGDTETAITYRVQAGGLCDVYEGRLTRAKERRGAGSSLRAPSREVLARQDIDTVIVATPDHWHSQIRRGSHGSRQRRLLQKPMVKHWQDGHRLIETAREERPHLAVGSQRVSSVVYKKAQELFAPAPSAHSTWSRRGSTATPPWALGSYSIPPEPVRDHRLGPLLGGAPKHPLRRRSASSRRRNWSDYGTGVAGDLFVHLFRASTSYRFLGPVRVFAAGGTHFWKGDRDAPDMMLGLYDYPKHGPAIRPSTCRLALTSLGGGETAGFQIHRLEGVMTIGNGISFNHAPKEQEPGMTAGGFSRATAEKIITAVLAVNIPRRRSPPSPSCPWKNDFRAPPRPAYSDDFAHRTKNFFNAVRSRQPVVEDAEFGLRAAGPALLANMSYYEGRIKHWDPVTMRVVEA